MRSLVAGILSLTLPQSAGAGQPRIVIGPFLPPPLATFTWQGGTRRYIAALIFYDTGDDTTYTFIGLVRNGSGTPGVMLHVGAQVRSGAVVVDAAGTPLAGEWFFQTGPARQFMTLLSNQVNVTATGAFGNVVLTAAQFLNAIATSGVQITAPSVTTSQDLSVGGSLSVAVDETVGRDLTVTRDINTTGDYRMDGQKVRTLTDSAGAPANGSLNPSAAITLVPGTTINVVAARANAVLKVRSVWDMQQLLASPTTTIGYIYIDGVQQAARMNFAGVTAGVRGTLSLITPAPVFVGAGLHTIELRAQNTGSSTAHLVNSVNTTIEAELWE